MYKTVVLYLLLLAACSTPSRIISYKALTLPVYPVSPLPKKILLLNAFDIESQHDYREKKALLLSLADRLLDSFPKNFLADSLAVTVLRGYTNCGSNTGSAVQLLLQQTQCTHAIVICDFDILFDKETISTYTNQDGAKIRSGVYYMVSFIVYAFYTRDSLFKTVQVRERSNTALMGNIILGTRPGMRKHADEAWAITKQNGQQLLHYFFPGIKEFSRELFTGKGFEKAAAALAQNDYAGALAECMQLTESADKKTASRAMYNCAVLLERDNQPEEAKKYLALSLKTYATGLAWEMQNDYK